ncbi:WD40 repeat domain-containing protein [Limnoraphis robusta]|uniref:WD40 repeat domain-containing protein n=2 Tax=Limnoraphis robusta TaxID=1118279 RepID=UPI002B1F0D07|nr:hypothetical protein [Limnoraphis robusta]MEA5498900.1 hypothetical protein [Limnoraphis robusta BA-68 BA1]
MSKGWVISASDDNTLKVWNLQTGEEIVSFTGESDLFCCTVAPDGRTIVAGELSGRLHILRLEGIESESPLPILGGTGMLKSPISQSPPLLGDLGGFFQGGFRGILFLSPLQRIP